jgi:phage regulator Rha-like protein
MWGFSLEHEMQLTTIENNQTMSSREIAGLTGKRHDNVMQVCRSLKAESVCPEIKETPYTNEQNGQQYMQCVLSKRDSLVLVARLSPEFTARIVDRWQELEAQQVKPAYAIPKTLSEALRLGAELAQKVEDQAAQLAIAAPKVAVYEILADRKQDVSTTIVAKQLGTTAIKLNQFLRDKGVKWLSADLPKAGYMGWFNVVSDTKNGHEFSQCLVTPMGQIKIAEMWADR